MMPDLESPVVWEASIDGGRHLSTSTGEPVGASPFAEHVRTPRRGAKRPGQWTDETRAKRARRLRRAAERRLGLPRDWLYAG